MELTAHAKPSAGEFMLGLGRADSSDVSNPHRCLLIAAHDGDLELVRRLLDTVLVAPIDLAAHDQYGRTALALTAWSGHTDIVRLLLERGASWHTRDNEGVTAGEYALLGGHCQLYEQLVSAGVQAELVMHALGEGDASNDYLSSRIRYTTSALIDSSDNGVMMSWETPLMCAHADIMQCAGRDVLNVGFGMGIVDTEIQKRGPRTHTIIEAHPDVYARMLAQGWDKMPGVRVLFGRWQDVLSQLDTYDAVMFDTFDETDVNLCRFHEALLDLLRPSGTYTFFNGLAATNSFFHDVCCEVTSVLLAELGLQTQYIRLPIDVSDERIWADVKDRYWTLKEYRLPVCTFLQ